MALPPGRAVRQLRISFHLLRLFFVLYTLHTVSSSRESESGARLYLEALRWPNGAIVCPHCAAADSSRRVRSARSGLWFCRACRRQFTVAVGTLFEDSRLPLTVWLQAISLLCASPSGLSIADLSRHLAVTYRTAWKLAKKLQYAIGEPPLAKALAGKRRPDATRR